MTTKMRNACFILFFATFTATNNIGMEDAEKLADRIERLQELEDHCTRSSDLPLQVSKSCVDWLNDYFEDEPIWNTSMLIIFQRGHGDLLPPALNKRPLTLPYSVADESIKDLPRWRDVFDGHNAERLDVVLGALDDEICHSLGIRGEITPVHVSRCHARELFKYASYLDACVTGIDRSSFLHMKVGEDRLMVYERARKNMDPSLIVNEDERNGWQLVETYLHTIWITKKCSPTFSNVIGDLAEHFKHITQDSDLSELKSAMRPMHDTFMAIAARAGDPWAIQSFYVDALYSDHDYWKSLHELNPFLFHRLMAIKGRLWFEKKDQAFHALEAYKRERIISPQLDLDQYLRNFGITHEDFDLPSGSIASLLEDEDWQYNLKYPWTVEDKDYE